MKKIELELAELTSCVAAAQQEQVVLTRGGQPVALLIGLDDEQRELGSNGEFWRMIAERRAQPTISHAEMVSAVTYDVGEEPGAGRYCCAHCRWTVDLDKDSERLPPCGRCEKGQSTEYVGC